MSAPFTPTRAMVDHLRREVGITEDQAENVIRLVFEWVDSPLHEAGAIDADYWLDAMGAHMVYDTCETD